MRTINLRIDEKFFNKMKEHKFNVDNYNMKEIYNDEKFELMKKEFWKEYKSKVGLDEIIKQLEKESNKKIKLKTTEYERIKSNYS